MALDDAECSAIYGPKYSKECSGSNQNACCAVDEECGNWLGKAYCIKNCPTDTTACNNPWNPFDNTTDCCLDGATCQKVNGFYQCSYPDESACPAATHHCPGETLSLCCPEGTVCSNNGAGAAVCTDVDGVKCSVDEHCGSYSVCVNEVGPDYAISEVTTGFCVQTTGGVGGNCDYAVEMVTCSNGCANGRCSD